MLKINKREIAVSGAVIGLLVFFHYLGVIKPLEALAAKAINPLMSRVYVLSAKIRLSYDRQTSKVNFAQRSKELEEQLNKAIEENAKLRAVEEENKILREYLDFNKKKQLRYLMANVISRGNFGSLSDRTEVISIDKGSRDGLYKGLAVVNSQGILVGKIAELKEATSLVYLTNNSKCKLAAEVIGNKRTSGITEGELGLIIRMNFIPQAEIIKPGDMIITSGLEPAIPRSLVIGQVKEVNKESNELWQTAIIEPLVKPEDLIVVSVVFP